MAWILSVGEGWYHVDMSIVPVAFASAPSISHCPECGYCLTGLPARHRCPECGFEYDEFTRVWKPRWPRAIYALASFPLIILLSNLSNFRFRAGLTGVRGIAISAFAVIAVAVCVRRFFRAKEANARGRYVAIAPAGLMIRTEGEPVIIPWRNLVKVRHRWWMSQLRIEVDDPVLNCRIQPLFEVNLHGFTIHEIVADKDRKAFARAVNEAIQRHRDAAAAPAMA